MSMVYLFLYVRCVLGPVHLAGVNTPVAHSQSGQHGGSPLLLLQTSMAACAQDDARQFTHLVQDMP